jgi:excisionase family DNA binding protein
LGHRIGIPNESMAIHPIEKSFCTSTEAARLLGVSVATVQLWTESGLLVAWKTEGGHRRIQRASVDSLLYRNAGIAAIAAPDAPASSPRRNLKVVAVDDDINLLRLYAVRIQAWSEQVQLQTFDNAYSALLAVGRQSPDLLLMDLHMPDLDGFAMLKILHLAPEMRATRTVVVSGLDADSIAARGGLPPGIEMLPKPVPFDRLEAIGQTLLQTRQAAPALPSSLFKAAP